MINVAIAAFGSIQIRTMPDLGLNLGPFAHKADTLPLLRSVVSILIIQLNKANSMQVSDATFQIPSSTPCAANI